MSATTTFASHHVKVSLEALGAHFKLISTKAPLIESLTSLAFDHDSKTVNCFTRIHERNSHVIVDLGLRVGRRSAISRALQRAHDVGNRDQYVENEHRSLRLRQAEEIKLFKLFALRYEVPLGCIEARTLRYLDAHCIQCPVDSEQGPAQLGQCLNIVLFLLPCDFILTSPRILLRHKNYCQDRSHGAYSLHPAGPFIGRKASRPPVDPQETVLVGHLPSPFGAAV